MTIIKNLIVPMASLQVIQLDILSSGIGSLAEWQWALEHSRILEADL